MVEDKEVDIKIAAPFLKRVLPRGGKVAIGGAKQDNINLIEWLDSVQERNHKALEDKLGKLTNKGARNFFFTPFGFDRQRRIQANARASRVFLCDLDVGPSKHYKTRDEALTALCDFIEESGIQPSEIVNSGYGLHAYWIADQDLALSDWREVALRLHALRKAWGIVEDETVPEDPSQYIRLPGTTNNKADVPKDVFVIGSGSVYNISDLQEQIGELFATSEKGRRFLESGDEFDRMRRKQGARDLVSETSQANEQDVYDCPENLEVAKRMLLAIPATLYSDLSINRKGQVEKHNATGVPSYELWRSVIFSALATKLTGIEAAIYEWAAQSSDQYPDWQEAVEKVVSSDGVTGNGGVGVGTLIHFGRAFGRQQSGYDPGRFEFFAEDNIRPFDPQVLLQKKAKDPNAQQVTDLDEIEAGVEVQTVGKPASDDTDACAVMPKGFRRVNGSPGIHKIIPRKDDETGQWLEPELLRITDEDMYVIGNSEENGTNYFSLKVFPPHQDPQVYKFSKGILSDPRSFARQMAEADILPSDIQVKGGSALMSYITAQSKRLRGLRGVEKTVDSFGWTPSGKEFVKGSRIYSDKGPRDAVSVSSSLKDHAAALDAHGSLDLWKDAVSIFDRDEFLLCQMLLAMSMGAPLTGLYNAEHSGGFIYIWSTKGSTGKSTMQRVMQSVWGRPSQSVLIGDTDTSEITLPNQMGVLKDISLAIDEGVTETSAYKMDEQRSKLAKLIKNSTQGRSKMRSDQSGNLKSTSAKWSAFTSISLNMSLDNMLGDGYSGPIAQRVLEVPYAVPRFSDLGVDPGDAFEFGHRIKNNYGAAGDALVDYFVKNREEVRESIHEEMKRLANVGGGLDEFMRFYQSMFASAHVAARIAKKLGLFDFDISKLSDFMDDYLKKTLYHVSEKSTLDVPGILSEFINLHESRTITVYAEAGKGTQLVSDYPRDGATIRINQANKEVSISANELRKHAYKYQVSWDDVVNFVSEKMDSRRKDVLKRRDPYQGLAKAGNIRLQMICFNADTVIQGDKE